MKGAALAAVALGLTGCTWFGDLPGDSSSAGERLFRVPSAAMEPTIHCAPPAPGCLGEEDDRIVVRPVGRPGRGDIVVFETPPAAQARCGAGGLFVKRVVALPGERWEQRRGFVYVDGRRLAEPYVRPRRRGSDSFRRRKVPANHFFLMGDNRTQSCDSRVWGPAPSSAIVGKVVAIQRGSKRLAVR